MVPHQYEFARLKLTYTVVRKRKLVELVESGLVNGWNEGEVTMPHWLATNKGLLR